MKIIKLNDEARASLKTGIDKAANIIKQTLGVNGSNVLVQILGDYIPSNDGILIAKNIILEDEVENAGARLIEKVADETNEEVGDGTTTSVTLAQAIIDKGYQLLSSELIGQSGKRPMEVKRAIDRDYEKVITALDKIKKPIKSEEDLQHIATISAESKELGKTIADLFNELGKDGVVTVEDSNGFEIESEVVDGFEIPKGHLSPYMGTKTELEDIDVLMTTERLDNLEHLLPLMEQRAKDKKKNLVIVAHGFSEEVIKTFVVNKLQGGMNIYGIEVPKFNEEDLKDINSLVGGEIYDPSKGDSQFILGLAKKVVISKNTIITGDSPKKKVRIKELKAKKPDTDFEKSKIEKSISRLTNGIGVIKVGANSESEREYLKLKIEDAINATKAALQDGVVKGGGITLNDMEVELEVIGEALQAPYKQIQANGKVDIGEDVLDPVKVTKTALKKACSLAGIILTAEAVVVDKVKKEDDK